MMEEKMRKAQRNDRIQAQNNNIGRYFNSNDHILPDVNQLHQEYDIIKIAPVRYGHNTPSTDVEVHQTPRQEDFLQHLVSPASSHRLISKRRQVP